MPVAGEPAAAAGIRPLWHSLRLCHARHMPPIQALPTDHEPGTGRHDYCLVLDTTPGITLSNLRTTMRRPAHARAGDALASRNGGPHGGTS